MQKCIETLHGKTKKLKKFLKKSVIPPKKGEITAISELRVLFGSLDGSLPEFFEILHEFKGSFACTGTCSLISFCYLCVGVGGENSVLSFDFLDKFFHDSDFLKVLYEEFFKLPARYAFITKKTSGMNFFEEFFQLTFSPFRLWN